MNTNLIGVDQMVWNLQTILGFMISYRLAFCIVLICWRNLLHSCWYICKSVKRSCKPLLRPWINVSLGSQFACSKKCDDQVVTWIFVSVTEAAAAVLDESELAFLYLSMVDLTLWEYPTYEHEEKKKTMRALKDISKMVKRL